MLSSLLTGTDALTWGIPILGLPQAEEIVSARATFAGSTAEVKPADMELAKNLPGVLHAWFGRAEERMPQAVMTYTLADGSEVVIAAARSFCWVGTVLLFTLSSNLKSIQNAGDTQRRWIYVGRIKKERGESHVLKKTEDCFDLPYLFA